MKNNFLLDLLVDPVTKDPLMFDNVSNTLSSSLSGNIYQIIESVPRILPDENQSVKKTNLHLESGTNFKYKEHYLKDSEIFDYSERNLPVIIKNEFRRLRESILDEISDEMSLILDVGCGNGWASKKLIPLEKKVISLDISPVNTFNAIKNVQHENHAGLIADVYNLPLKENTIDCIIASEILEHVPDPKTFINNLIKLLKDSGKLIISTPYNEKIEYYLCVHCNRPTPKNAHLHSFNESNIILFIPEKGVSWTFKKFANKYLSKIRSHIILKFFPYKFWSLIDNIFNIIFHKPTRLKIIIKKTSQLM
jgi:2-polyprenyl-3-methyl-5-hydroxy-6-metoxy-1,4-benzoquinol methylase